VVGHDTAAAGVTFPPNGRLLLSPAAGTVALTRPEGVGWKPTDATLPASQVLYVPSATAPNINDHGYVLAAGTDLDDLERKILTAMEADDPFTIAVSQGSFVGEVVLHGATLPYAVLCPQAPTA
jgi:hypothetical protein